MTKKGERRWASKKPLVDSGTLAAQIQRTLLDDHTLFVYSTMEYAAMQQFGGKKSEFPHLWGDIPARPFFGISDADQAEITRIVKAYLQP